ncbi:sugar transferase [Rhabdobacter roseus]|uniref:Lipopolysaccharide/colanic/teichoic acid biosynthesis glycosyltransferase n=1 Tax=Rhabdobacter roseus TaxID=1655419 RepID=A0A840U150_9BACT|nr:sugar transferase [Rhabdobacter roseus]MBB5287313.1 lipopolysaccharide/colanic/teichoic acid biosynthesis glycosyltransferase [Rhabdobacter roseus]
MEKPVTSTPTAAVSTPPLLRVVYFNDHYEQSIQFINRFGEQLQIEYFDRIETALNFLQKQYPVDAVIASFDSGGMRLLRAMRDNPWFHKLPLILTANTITPELIREALQHKADDVFPNDFSRGDLLTRLHYFVRRQHFVAMKASQKVAELNVRTPLWKRGIDMLVTGTALLLLSPLLLLMALLIKLDSKGPVVYKSKRVGAGYKIFELYKFRTMRTDADQLIKKMASFNMYNKQTEPAPSTNGISLCSSCSGLGKCQQLLFLDGEQVCEKQYQQQKEAKAAFMKFQNDPRITKLGRFLRNTSIDELPQLYNIFKGDMSLVGNRPLPLYEAEKLTTDEHILRFAGPAGLTGLWQVTKRGKGKKDMSEEERIQLDIEYAQNFSFWMDMKIVLKTFPALLQSENV